MITDEMVDAFLAAYAKSNVDIRNAALEEAKKEANDHAEAWGRAHGTPAIVIRDAIEALKTEVKS